MTEKKYDIIIRQVKEIVSGYTTKLTLRQIYYRLVVNLIIENNRSQYQYLSKALVKGRKNGDIDYEVIEDRTRKVVKNIRVSHTFWRETVKYKIDEITDNPYIWRDKNVLQKTITLIVVEKEALEGIFLEAISDMCMLIVCKGFNSLSQIKEFTNAVEDDKRDINCYFFSDFDPSGYDIQRNFKAQAEELGIKFNKFERIALDEHLVEFYNLPFNPTKEADPRASNWTFAGVVELDALEPNILTKMIKDCIKENYDYDLEKWKSKVRNIQQRKANKLYAKKLIETAKKIIENN